MHKRSSFSIRKLKVGVLSVLIGTFLLAGAQLASADSLTSEVTSVELVAENVSEVADSLPTAVTDTGVATTEETTAVASETPVVESPVETSSEVTSPVDAVTPLAVHGDESPSNLDSNEIITVPEAWKAGYKGEGMVVAIIDSGLDVNHEVLKLTDVSKAKYQSEDQMETAKKAAGVSYGKWYNDKVIFGYNYVDVNTNLYENDLSSHGMHVTSIAAGNPNTEQGGERIYGVAPEAQVMFMRVFSDIQSTTGPALYVRAIEDAVKLGADSINLSLGGAGGSVIDTDETLLAAIEAARRAGVSVVIAAGNDTAFGHGHSKPWAENPDYGLVGSPSTARDAISVASYNNTSEMNKVVQIVGLEGDESLQGGKTTFTTSETESSFEKGTVYEYVYANLGKEEDFANLDVAGKVALIKRGEIFFTEKIANATKHGSVGVVVFNNRPGANITMALDETSNKIPSIFIPQEFGEAMVKQPNLKLQFNDEVAKFPNPEAGKMSEFTSWGLSSDGDLKPDVTAPGGAIYAAYNDNQYGGLSGTSMASPHVAGVAVLVKQYLQKAYPDKTPAELEALVKNLIMSTAKPHFNKETNAYTSPRQQGAGIVDTGASVSTGLYVTGADNYSSLSLGNVGDTFSFDVTVHNITGEDKTLTYETALATDLVEDGLISLKPRHLSTTKGENITVPANGSKTVTVIVDATAFAEELSKQMPNGYYLDGFVRFLNTVDGGEEVSIPFVGFRGEFQNLPVVEASVYDLFAKKEGGFYLEFKENNVLTDADFATGLVTTSTEKVYSTGENAPVDLKVLGTFVNDEGNLALEFDKDNKPYLAISPNGDDNQDSFAFKGVFLRNFADLVATVYAADDSEMKNPLWTSKDSEGSKNFFSGSDKREKATVVFPTEWYGQDQDGNPLPDGKYRYVLTYYPEAAAAKQQSMAFDVVVDREAPVITTATYDEATSVFKPRKAIENGPLGQVYRERVFYLVKDDNGWTGVVDKDVNDNLVVVDNKMFVPRNEDGSYTLPTDVAELADFYYVVEDYAGNVVSAKVADLVSIGNDLGLVKVSLLEEGTEEDSNVDFSFAVHNSKGELVTELPRHGEGTDTVKLPFGEYTFSIFLYDTEWGTLVGSREVTVNLTEEESVKEAIFHVTTIAKGSLLVDVDKALPADTTVTLELSNGAKVNLPKARYSPTDFGKTVPVGDHNLLVNLPEGYEFLEDLAVTVEEGKRAVKTLHLIDKTLLLALVNAPEDLLATPAYYNANSEKQEAYTVALAKAKEVLASKVEQARVDAALQSLVAAKASLDGKVTDLADLTAVVAKEQDVKASPAYFNATTELQTAYDVLVRKSVLTLAKDKVTQAEVNAVLSELLAAQTALDGKATDYTALTAEVEKYTAVIIEDARYFNGTADLNVAYDKLVAEAKALLAQSSSTQAVVDTLLAKLVVALAALDGKATDYTALRNALGKSSLLKATDARYLNGSDHLKEAYDKLLEEAKALLEKSASTQAEVDALLVQLEEAEKTLDGKATVAVTTDDNQDTTVKQDDTVTDTGSSPTESVADNDNSSASTDSADVTDTEKNDDATTENGDNTSTPLPSDTSDNTTDVLVSLLTDDEEVTHVSSQETESEKIEGNVSETDEELAKPVVNKSGVTPKGKTLPATSDSSQAVYLFLSMAFLALAGLVTDRKKQD